VAPYEAANTRFVLGQCSNLGNSSSSSTYNDPFNDEADPSATNRESSASNGYVSLVSYQPLY